MVGIVSIQEALNMAKEHNLDLVEISPNATPPVCKILDFGKYKFEQQRKLHKQRKKQKIIHLKEIKLRPNTDTHDYDVKMRSVKKFINSGDKVKISIRFRGREISHKELGMELMKKVQAEMESTTKLELAPRLEGRQMIMVLAPKSHT